MRLIGLIAGVVVCVSILVTSFSRLPWTEIVAFGILAALLRLRPVPLLRDAKGSVLLSHVPGESVLLIVLLRHGAEASAMASLVTNLIAFGRIWRTWLLVPERLLGALSTIVWLPFLAALCGWLYAWFQGQLIRTPADCLLLFQQPDKVLLPLLGACLLTYELTNRIYMSVGLALRRLIPLRTTLFDINAGLFEHLENVGALLALAMWTTWGWGTLPFAVLIMEALLLSARERVQRQEARSQATSDPLTGLASARGLSEAIQKRLRAPHQPFALLYLDMDGFKHINDTYGHAIGDLLLGLVARALQDSVQPGEVAGRRGGDEFVLLLLKKDRSEAEQALARLRSQVERALGEDTRFDFVGFSAGIALYPGDGVSEDALLEAADRAMYAEKRLRRLARAA